MLGSGSHESAFLSSVSPVGPQISQSCASITLPFLIEQQDRQRANVQPERLNP